jgi:flagellar basal body-associated protein FliL
MNRKQLVAWSNVLLIILLVSLPVLYYHAVTTIPYSQSPELKAMHKHETEMYVSQQQGVTLEQIEDNTSMSYIQMRYITTEMSEKDKLVKCQDQIYYSSECPVIGNTLPPIK